MRLKVKYLTKNRHGTYVYRRELSDPKLRAACGGKKNYIRSLGTSDKSEALRLFPDVARRAEDELSELKAGHIIISEEGVRRQII